MKEIKNQIKDFSHKITFESLGKFVDSIDFDNLNYQDYILNPESEGDYGRNILELNPFECVLINWPAGVESSVHHHQGLFGHVLVLEGELDNITYREENHKLIEFKYEKYISKGIMPEEDGVIHKLANRNLEKRAITLHFYYPAIDSFEGRRVFNGLDMFIYQGQKSFYLWNKINPEIDDELVELLNSKLK